jgi:hypothetical protein
MEMMMKMVEMRRLMREMMPKPPRIPVAVKIGDLLLVLSPDPFRLTLLHGVNVFDEVVPVAHGTTERYGQALAIWMLVKAYDASCKLLSQWIFSKVRE